MDLSPNGPDGSSFYPDPATGRRSSAADPATGRLRDPGSPVGGVLAWLAIAALVCFTIGTSLQMTLAPAAASAPSPDVAPPGGLARLMARYIVGAGRLVPESQRADLLSSFDDFSDSSPEDRLRAALLAGELRGAEEARARLDAFIADFSTPEPPPDPNASATELDRATAHAEHRAALLADAAALRAIYDPDSGAAALTPDQRATLEKHHGWFARLALTHGLPDTDPARQSILRGGTRVVAALLTGVILAAAAFIVGFVLFILAIVRISGRRMRPAYSPPAPGGTVYLETVGLFFVAFVLVQFLAASIENLTGADFTPLLIWLLLPIAFWPRLRGATRAEWKHAVGWHRGRGFAREVLAGVVGYLAGLPILALGLLTALALSFLMTNLAQQTTGAPAPPPSHPVIDGMGSGGWLGIAGIYLLGVVWAPLVEETIFRGAFYHHLRGRLSALASGALVAFVFAAIHPQGVALIPGLMALAIVFALMREWRGSLIPSITAHALHNCTLLTILIVALS